MEKNRVDRALERITQVRGDGFIMLKPDKSLPRELALLILEEASERELQRVFKKEV